MASSEKGVLLGERGWGRKGIGHDFIPNLYGEGPGLPRP